ncbi:MAG: hypothetical protein NT007_18515 [Candidatus Kapabacteria bacterium]|nr:hypothetical protein [Candidatus Kapabacteria bacterium]
MATNGITAANTGLSAFQTIDPSQTQQTGPTHQHHRHANRTGDNGQVPDPTKFLSMLQSKLGLNDNQVLDLKKLLQKDFDSLSVIKPTSTTNGTNSSTGTVANSSDRKSTFTKINTDIMSVLTPAQQQSFNVLFKGNDNDGDAT